VIPVAVTVLFVPTVALANVAAVAAHVTPAGFPDSVQPVIVAVVVPSYTLLAAVTEAVTGVGGGGGLPLPCGRSATAMTAHPEFASATAVYDPGVGNARSSSRFPLSVERAAKPLPT